MGCQQCGRHPGDLYCLNDDGCPNDQQYEPRQDWACEPAQDLNKITDDEILDIADSVYRKHSIDMKPGYVQRARLDFARHIEAVTLARAAKAREERRNQV